MDRIDIITEVSRIEYSKLSETPAPEFGSQLMAIQVKKAREIQYARQGKGVTNARLMPANINTICQLNETCMSILNKAANTLDLSMRSYHRIQKLARTIADLDHSETIEIAHLSEAIQLRRVSWSR